MFFYLRNKDRAEVPFAVVLRMICRGIATTCINPENANIAVLTDATSAQREAASLELEVVEL